jgi:hypothetical protein
VGGVSGANLQRGRMRFCDVPLKEEAGLERCKPTDGGSGQRANDADTHFSGWSVRQAEEARRKPTL